MGQDAEDFSALLHDVYAAAVEPGLWAEAVGSIARAADCIAGLLQIDSNVPRRLLSLQQHGFPSEMLDRYVRHFAAVDPRVTYSFTLTAGQMFEDGQVMDRAARARHPYYADHIHKFGFGEFWGGSIHADQGISVGLSVHRAYSLDPVSSVARRLIAIISPHVARAVCVGNVIAAAELRSSAAAEAMEHLALGIVILDREGRPIHANAALRTIVADHDGIGLSADGLRFGHRIVQTHAQRLLANAIATASGFGLEAGGQVAVTRPSGRRPYRVTIAPLPLREPIFIADRPAAIVLVADPERAPAPAVETLRALYRLTPRETELAIALADGATLSAVAERLGITVGTARVHMTTIYAKTGTTRQAELVSLLARLQ